MCTYLVNTMSCLLGKLLRPLLFSTQGILQGSPRLVCQKEQLVRLWAHECQRVFFDRLVDDCDRTWFQQMLIEKVIGRTEFLENGIWSVLSLLIARDGVVTHTEPVQVAVDLYLSQVKAHYDLDFEAHILRGSEILLYGNFGDPRGGKVSNLEHLRVQRATS